MLLLPAVQQAREAARRTQCRNNLKNIVLALHNYHDTYNTFPAAQWYCGHGQPCTNQRPTWSHGWGWTASILPYIDQAPLYNQINFQLDLYDPTMQPLVQTNLEVFGCPSDATRRQQIPPSGSGTATERLATTSYIANGGPFNNSFNSPNDTSVNTQQNFNLWTSGVMGRDTKIQIRDITDGTSNTFLAGETTHYDFTWDPSLYGHWDVPSGTACCTLALARHGNRKLNPPLSASNVVKREGFSSLHEGGAFFAICDGSIRFVSENVDANDRQWNAMTRPDPFDKTNNGAGYAVYQRLFSRNDGLVIGEF